jgi:hypothetical protein
VLNPLRSEALGDWNNIKGTEYHLVYALWLLVRERAANVAFYQGNDLAATPIPPPSHASEEQIVAASAQDAGKDIWIQLKATQRRWTCSKILSGSLVPTFVWNSLLSTQRGRQAKIQLVTQGQIDRDGINEFLANPGAKPLLNQKLEERIREAVQGWANWMEVEDDKKDSFDQATIRQLTLDVIRQIARTEPVPLSTLKAEIEAEIHLVYPDRRAGKAILDRIIGRMVQEAARGPKDTCVLDASWLDEAAGCPLHPQGRFDRDPVEACITVNDRYLRQLEWTAKQYEPRQYVEDLIDRFLVAEESIFVLLGGQGSGKSWTAASQIAARREGWVPLLIRGTELDRLRELDKLIAHQFRRDTQADINDHQLTQKLTAAMISRESRLLLVLDGVSVPSYTDRDVYCRDLGRLAEACQELGAKLIITCDEGVWHHYRLGETFKAEVFQEDDVSLGLARKSYSLALASLTVDELTGIAQRRLGTECGAQVAAWLEKPAFQPLRNPSLLDQYLREHVPADWRPGQPLEPVTVDELIDKRIKSLADVVAGALGYDEGDVQRALDDLVPSFWRHRYRGVPQREVVTVLDEHFPGLGNEAVRAMITEGLLTLDGRLRITDSAIFAQMAARWLGERTRTGEAVEAELRLGQDDGVVTALVRGMLTDSLDWAEQLIARDRGWVRAVAQGLAEGPSRDLGRLAWLVGLTRAADGEGINTEACQALGTLAARSRCARKWLAQMYLSGNRLEQARGEIALGAALDFNPRWVGACIRLRLTQPAVQEHRKFGQPTVPDHVLAPLVRSKHMLATRVARRLLQRSVNLPIDESDRESVRGVVAAVDPEVGNEWSESILSELRSGDPAVRRRAAKAALPIVQRKPEVAQNAVLAALQEEDTPEVVILLLSAAYNLAEVAPDELLDALRASCLLKWSPPAPWIGPVLALLAELASNKHSVIKDIVPARLESLPPEDRAWLSEILSYVWWRVGEYDATAQGVLRSLTKPGLRDVPNEYRTFAVRGAVIAQLALMCLDSEPGQHLSELPRVMFYPNTQRRFLYLDISDLLEQRASILTKHPSVKQLIQLLHQCIREEAEHEADVLSRSLRGARYHCARMCVELLAYLASAGPDPLSTIGVLPRDWQALAAVNCLLETGCVDERVISFAQEACDQHRHSGTANALAERDRCLALLARPAEDPIIALEETGRALWPSGWSTPGRAETLEQLCHAHPEHILMLVSQAVTEEEAIPTLYEWGHRARGWRTVLLSQAYARMFETTPLTNMEAHSLCEQVLALLKTLPDSPLRKEYHTVYRILSEWLVGERLLPPAMETEEALISQSHDHALTILRRVLKGPDIVEKPNWVGQLLNREAGWIETTSYQIKQGRVSGGSGLYAIYVLPAVRLALHAIGRQAGVTDPAGKFMLERTRVWHAFGGQHWVLQGEIPQSVLPQARDSLRKQLQLTPYDERLWERLGYVLLSMRELEDAYEALQNCLELPTCGKPTKVTASCNLACVCAQMGHEKQCQTMLEEAFSLDPEQREWARNDPDLGPVRGQPWFDGLVGEE